jgi:type II secretory pathway pseudopilin PulG
MNKGFTIIELIVAIASFIIILSITLGGFTGALKTQRQTIGLINANNNASLILEQMAREIRTGYNFPNSTTQELKFTNSEGKNVCYKQNGTAIVKGIDTGSGCSSYKKITADDVEVKYLNFMITGENPSDNKQPFITILMGISSQEASVKGIVVNLQTSISPRPLDS